MPIRHRGARLSSATADLMRTIVAAATLCAATSAALAGFWLDPKTDQWFWREKVWTDDYRSRIRDIPINSMSLFFGKPPPRIEAAPATEAAPAAIPADIRNAVYQIDNGSFTVESGEPLAFPAMKRTGWRLFVADRSGRVVVSTYGSTRFGKPLDTAIGVYRKTPAGGGKLIARNHDVPVAGGYGRASFAAFDAVEGTYYAIQFGDVGSNGGDMLLTTTTFGAGGGLVVQPVSPYDGYAYSCTRQSGQSGSCQSATYVVYNAAASALRVSIAASGLGAGAAPPPAFTLAPGAAAVKTIAFGATFGAAGKASSGGFAFTGSADGKVVARTVVPARVAVHDGGGPAAALRISAQAATVAAPQGAVVTQILKVENVDSAAATNCYVKPGLNETLIQAAWARYDEPKGIVSSAPYAPFDLAPGKTASIVVAMRSLRDRLADAAYERPYEIACASGPSFPSVGPDLSNVLDFTASVAPFADMALTGTIPKSGVLTVAPKGSVMTARFLNDGAAAVTLTAKVVERTIHEFGGPKRYKLSICPAAVTDAACLASTASSIDVTAPAGKPLTLKVGVKPPSQDPGFDPKLIGLALTLSQPYSATSPAPIPIAGVTKALERQ